MAGKQVVLYEWPASQICLECTNGFGIMHYPDSNALGDTPALCLVNYKFNGGSFKDGKCVKFDQRKEEDDDDTGFDLAGMICGDDDEGIENGDHNGV